MSEVCISFIFSFDHIVSVLEQYFLSYKKMVGIFFKESCEAYIFFC